LNEEAENAVKSLEKQGKASSWSGKAKKLAKK
jgi:hypothetical protein